MAKPEPQLLALMEAVQVEARRRYARWDDGVFEHGISWQTRYLWSALEKQPANVRSRSVRVYLDAIASAVGAGYVSVNHGPARTLMEAFLCRLMPQWFARTPPKNHAKIAATAWNLADGAHREAAWMEQYLLARVMEFDDPMALEQKALELLKPVIEPQRDAAWRGPFTVTVVDIARHAPDFLPGEISALTPSLVRVADRRQKPGVGVLLASGGRSDCIGRMDGMPSAAAPVRAPDVAIGWAPDHVAVAGAIVALPLMACAPLHTLALPNGYLLATVQTSQRLWVIETP